MRELIDQLVNSSELTSNEYAYLLEHLDNENQEYLRQKAAEKAKQYYGKAVYVRGLIEFTNYCKNDCYYCGIRKSNHNAIRYHLTKEEILNCCAEGYQLGFRTFVLQGGEDVSYQDLDIVSIIEAIKEKYFDCALTLSIGEKSYDSYLKYYKAGADRYLLRHETANSKHYNNLHPDSLSAENRKRCLYDLKEIGYQVGCGFMVGSPHQTTENIVEDLMFIKELSPQMVGIGPFISHKDTPFREFANGSVDMTLNLIAIIRLMLPNILIPATTALGTLDHKGREKGILAGANVLMPNLSPTDVRKKYMLYDNKICTGDEAAQCRQCLQRRIEAIGYQIVEDRGDCKPLK
ncbi:iron-only hydrogenase maturation protein HydE [Lachnotalea glycerini]|uniref:Iron-only hydrogenase maturation protein HydE n=1 Tax=Lachnotalea glycerini TaxID=1763509 RepID=A0A255IME6_9FIRM|nr:[FeFe] hydrogenase H-cluster radical SAM maturase HydE [Lachnotalea glycerini]PXV85690.1 iron-only hydrogenase maturation protein HydE [Lachnotalea glycerini]RDY31366.1 [FeFe] hydrogenase H-cluster radical SAM maturase HydE [Lachnotalea glycerini]